MLPVASGEAVCVFVADWIEGSIDGVVAVPFDPPLTYPTDLASCWPPSDGAELLVREACRVRDAEGWLRHRSASDRVAERLSRSGSESVRRLAPCPCSCTCPVGPRRGC